MSISIQYPPNNQSINLPYLGNRRLRHTSRRRAGRPRQPRTASGPAYRARPLNIDMLTRNKCSEEQKALSEFLLPYLQFSFCFLPRSCSFSFPSCSSLFVFLSATHCLFYQSNSTVIYVVLSSVKLCSYLQCSFKTKPQCSFCVLTAE